VGGREPIGRIPAAKMRLVVDQKEDVAFELIGSLSRQAVETIAAAMKFAGKGPLIFRSVRHPHRPLSDSALSRTYREAGFTGLHDPHGWRSTFCTVMNELAGVESSVGDRAVIELMLAPVPSNTVEAADNRAAYMSRARAGAGMGRYSGAAL